jgi:hypothetical protein
MGMTQIDSKELRRLKLDAKFAVAVRAATDHGCTYYRTRPAGRVVVTVANTATATLTAALRKAIEAGADAIFTPTAAKKRR